MGFNTKVIIAAVLILIGPLAFILFWKSPRAGEIEQLVARLAEMVNRRDVVGCMSHVADDYSHHGRTYQEIEALGNTFLKTQEYRSMEIRDLDADVHGDDAEASFVAAVTVESELMGRRFIQPWDVTLYFHKTDGVWKIVGIDSIQRRR